MLLLSPIYLHWGDNINYVHTVCYNVFNLWLLERHHKFVFAEWWVDSGQMRRNWWVNEWISWLDLFQIRGSLHDRNVFFTELPKMMCGAKYCWCSIHHVVSVLLHRTITKNHLWSHEIWLVLANILFNFLIAPIDDCIVSSNSNFYAHHELIWSRFYWTTMITL